MRTLGFFTGLALILATTNANSAQPMISVDGDALIGPNYKSYVWGWAFSDSPVTVRVLLNGTVIAEGAPFNPRQDLKAVHPSAPLNSGFEFIINPLTLPSSSGQLLVEAVDQEGNRVVTEGPKLEGRLPLGLSASSSTVSNGNSFEIWSEQALSPLTLSLTRLDNTPIEATIEPVGESTLENFADNHGLPIDKPLGATKGTIAKVIIGKNAVSEPTGTKFSNSDGHSFVGPTVLNAPSNSSFACSTGEPMRIFFPSNIELLRKGLPILENAKQAASHSNCVDIGVRARVEFLRTTFGAKEDFKFDPDFPENRRISSDGRAMTGGALNEVLNYAKDHNTSLLVTLDGGV
ncbi:putative secreted protein [Brucella sp. 10RB9215]|uniref:hypothetical protein n=1 Tax=Brucella sp. 10RB9215 TaxID=1149953 RepID=UPI000909535E|nr:hypothetical protein [Brucella sp. 10RB9215]SBW14022.1 putative secreted protein [Brucella sp. 10RB9215]